jgi:hypothetical protein
VVCDFLLETGAPITVAIGQTKTPSNPAMVRLGGGKLVLAYGATQNEFPAPGPPVPPSADLRFAVLDGLGPWPTGPIQPLSSSWSNRGESFALEAPPGLDPALRVASTEALGGELVGPVSVGGCGLDGTATAPFELSAAPPAVRFFARGGGSLSASLVGLDGGSQGHHLINVLSLAAGGAPLPLLGDTGCATAPLVADALQQGDRFLVSTSSSRPAFSCLDDNGVDGPPTRLQLLSLGPKAADATLAFEMDLGAPLQLVRLLPHGTGSWLVSSAGDSLGAPVRMIPVTESGFPGAALVHLTDGAVLPDAPALDAMNDERVTIAYVEQGGQIPHLMLRAVTLSSAATTEINADLPHQLAVLGLAPDTIIVSWTDGFGPGTQLRVARYQCMHAE